MSVVEAETDECTLVNNYHPPVFIRKYSPQMKKNDIFSIRLSTAVHDKSVFSVELICIYWMVTLPTVFGDFSSSPFVYEVVRELSTKKQKTPILEHFRKEKIQQPVLPT